ncbi:hypothetical protein SEA_EMIANNA_84 [Gordonia phage Emianna]|uniref:Uncharacterized protein n=2 Tax=Foxborovirus TaxID=2948710 RepID=A0A345L510_9CAUD|nr:hypothetical protein KNT99_gp82 [Gordonia phage NatB6]YP_010098972.1 hypothetical protein KNU15_gp84 [Gordonia phage Emianna]AYD84355.1 hypothetical protein SEA_KURT_84 [Gordonia phage Kurt]QOP66743.1 hypothetical protein SEA_NOVUMREGINA_82 [Gordonia phage NovumRegina]QOR55924.1 hypothetical protein SEA_GROOTJR_84 [Gordonia phage GrootJr]AXH50362.1 hypothetical protein SEA_NATB6_82 [Gordonia phage NatB6]AYD83467.1 hypothetical protein SEA_EMIANNA_84 [Gordonia phage Emianna]
MDTRIIDHVDTTRIGTQSDDGLLQLTDIGCDTDTDDAVSVTVRELIGHNGWTCSPRSLDKRMRRFAARCSGYGDRARVSVERRWIAYGCDNVTYSVRPADGRPGERSRARLDGIFAANGWRSAASDKSGHPDVYVRDTTHGGPRAMVQVYRDPARGRVTGATLFDDDGRAYPFPSHGTLRAVSAYLLGYRWKVTTYNGAVPTFGVRYGPSGSIVFPTEPAARRYFKRVNREQSATITRVPPADKPAGTR